MRPLVAASLSRVDSNGAGWRRSGWWRREAAYQPALWRTVVLVVLFAASKLRVVAVAMTLGQYRVQVPVAAAESGPEVRLVFWWILEEQALGEVRFQAR